LLFSISCSFSLNLSSPLSTKLFLFSSKQHFQQSTARRFSKQELADEAPFYGIDSHLRNATSRPPFSGIDASIVVSVRPASEGLSSTFTVAENGSVWIAHGGQVSSYDCNLIHSVTVHTHLDEINSICRVSPEIAAAGIESVAGNYFKLHIKKCCFDYDLFIY